MKGQTQAFLVGTIGIAGALLLLGLTAYPFQYGLKQSALLVGVLILLAVFETVLGDTSF